MIEFLQVIDGVLFLTIAYHIIKLSPLLEMAQFTNMPTLNTYKTLPREALINSMNNAYESKITTSCVSKLSNSGAITCVAALGLAHESHIHLSRVNQRFPSKQGILMNKPARHIKVSYTSKFHYAGMTFAHQNVDLIRAS